MIKNILLLILLTFTVSCSFQYDGETRLIVEGNLKDREGNSLAGKSAYVRFSNGSDEDIISNTVTDSSGHFLMIFPAPDFQNDEIDILLGGDATHQSKYLSNLHTTDFSNYKYKLNETLYESEDITQLNIIFAHVNFDKHLKNISIEGLQTYFEKDFDRIYQDDAPRSFFVIKNQELVLHYTIHDQITGVSTDYAEPVIIGNSNIDYTITY